MSFGCDWFQAGLTLPVDVDVDDLFFVCDSVGYGSGNAFYTSSRRDDVGMVVYYNQRPGCEGNPDATVELKGTWFTNRGSLDRLLRHWESLGVGWDLQRFDARHDFHENPPEETPVKGPQVSQATLQEWKVNGKWTGWRLGKNERVWRFYDKAQEQGCDGPWWRLELVLRGNYVKALDGKDELTLCLQAFTLGKDCIQWSEFFKTLWEGVASAKVARSYCATFQGAFLHAKRMMKSAITGFAKQFGRHGAGMVLDVHEVADLLFREVSAELRDPLRLIGGSGID